MIKVNWAWFVFRSSFMYNLDYAAAVDDVNEVDGNDDDDG